MRKGQKFFQVSFLLFMFFGAANLFAEQKANNYPIVLVHGLFGYSDRLLGLPSDYWSDIPELLKEQGAVVFQAQVSQAKSSYARGEQLYEQLKEWGYEKYNIIGHSMGGIDGRYVMERYPEMVASLTTIASPHKGSPVADFLQDALEHSDFSKRLVNFLGDTLGYLVGLLAGELAWQNSYQAINFLSSNGMAGFNRAFTAGINSQSCTSGDEEFKGIKLFSWGSVGSERSGFFDFFGRLMEKSSRLFGTHERNDGLVSECSMMFGKWLGAIEGGHHLVPVGGVINSVPSHLKGWPDQMFLTHFERLRSLGL